MSARHRHTGFHVGRSDFYHSVFLHLELHLPVFLHLLIVRYLLEQKRRLGGNSAHLFTSKAKKNAWYLADVH